MGALIGAVVAAGMIGLVLYDAIDVLREIRDELRKFNVEADEY